MVENKMEIMEKLYLGAVCSEYFSKKEAQYYFKNNVEKFIAIIDNEGNKAIFTKTDFLGIPCLEYLGQNDLSKNIADEIYHLGYRFIISEYFLSNLYKCSAAAFGEGEFYFFNWDSNIFAIKESEAEEILKAYEIAMFPVLNEENLIIETLSGPELYNKFLNKHGNLNDLTWRNSNRNHSYIGMHYFDGSYEEFRNEEIKYLVARIEDRIIGVICFGHWDDRQFAMSYIDVSFPYRNKGIATKMIKALNAQIQEEENIYLTFESEMGKTVGIHALFKKYLSIPCITKD